MVTVTSTAMTVEEFSRLPRDGARHELNAGKLATSPPPKSLHTLAVLERLQAILKDQSLSRAIPEAGYVLSRAPLTIRRPDVSVLSKERIRATAGDDYFVGAPELAVEVASPRNSDMDLNENVHQYLSASSSGSGWCIQTRKP